MLTDPAGIVARVRRVLTLAFVLQAMLLARGAHAGDIALTSGPYVPTPQEVVEAMLELAHVGPRDFVVDLGSGDGRLVLTAAQRYGAQGLGVDLDRELVADSLAAARRLGLDARVTFRVEDVTRTPLAQASVVTLYLLPGLTELLKPRFLSELAPGARIVSHDFDLGDWKADRQVVMDVKEKYGAPGSWKSTLFLWTVPARVAGTWRTQGRGEGMLLRLAQRYQRVYGTAVLRGRTLEVVEGRLEGKRLHFVLRGAAHAGGTVVATVEDDRMEGTLARDGEMHPWSALRVAD